MRATKTGMARTAVLIAALWATSAGAATLLVKVTDEQGRPVSDAVVVARAGSPRAPASRTTRVVDQIDKEFLPYVSVVPMGTDIAFPNRDNVRHHVYSLSSAKKFELPLYAGTPAQPVRFDRPGVVTLGCNIHDWMIAHVYVSDSPYFGQSGVDGQIKLDDLPVGDYVVTLWHPRAVQAESTTARTVKLTAAAPAPMRFTVRLKRDFRPRRAPTGGQGSYR